MLVFVYGTLKRNRVNHRILRKQFKGKFIGQAKVHGYAIYMCLYPMAVAEEGSTIHGELYEVPVEKIQGLDFMETGYTRKEVKAERVEFPTSVYNGVNVPAQMYVWDNLDYLDPRKMKRRIANGNF